MKKVAIALISIVTLSMMLMAISPVMAKPGYVTIVVKDANNKPVPNVCVRIWQAKTPTAGPVSTLIRTNDRGKAVIPLNENFDYNISVQRGTSGRNHTNTCSMWNSRLE